MNRPEWLKDTPEDTAKAIAKWLDGDSKFEFSERKHECIDCWLRKRCEVGGSIKNYQCIRSMSIFQEEVKGL